MIDGAPITRVTSSKSLGVHIDKTLSRNVHVENLCKKIASGIEEFKRGRSFVLNGLTPDYLSSNFADRSRVSNYSFKGH